MEKVSEGVSRLMGIVADTHAVIWYATGDQRVSKKAKSALDHAVVTGMPIVLASISLVELIYLIEKKRVRAGVLSGLLTMIQNPKNPLELQPLNAAVCARLAEIPRESVPDMPDRIIAATALALGIPLVTADRKIRCAEIETIW